MDLVKLQLAEAEAHRFLATLKRLKEEHAALGAAHKARQDKAKKNGGADSGYIGYWKADRLTDMPRYTGAVKRASMDLSRALADLRGRNQRRVW